MRIRTIAAVVTAVVIVAPACGDDDATDDGPKRVQIEMTDFQFSPDLVAVSAGQTVEFVVTNNGAVEHEFRLTNQAEIDAHIAGGHQEHTGGDEMGDMSDDEMGDMSDDENMTITPVPAGETRTVTVTFGDDPAQYALIACLIPGHYEAGMVGEIRYTG